MRTLVAIAIMILVALLAGLMIYIVARRVLLTWHARLHERRRCLLETELKCWFSEPVASPPARLGKLRRWPDRGIFLALCLERLPQAEPELRKRLVASLDEHGFIDLWIGQLRQRDPWNRERAAELLGLARVPRSIGPLIDALDDPELDVRMRAARALGELGGPRARAALLAALTDENRWSAIRIADLLADMGDGVLDELRVTFPCLGRGARLAAIDVMARVGDEGMGQLFVTLLDDEDSDVRARSAAALGRIGYRPAVPELLRRLRDAAWPVRAMAAKSLGTLQIEASIPALCDALRDPEWWVRANSAEALRMLGPAGRQALAAMRDDSDRFARDQANAMLAAEAGAR
ncbi:MAG: HEAT repeat domain-containing protein [Gammaproteobacteria bacterium]